MKMESKLRQQIFIYIDESGSIHKNSNTKYFAVGGYFTTNQDKLKITSKYKRLNLKMKKYKELNINDEIKSYNMTKDEKINIFSKIQDIDTFYGCIKVFDKTAMKKRNYRLKYIF